MSEQLSLLEWKAPAEVVPFPSHRSHGATIVVARSIIALETTKRTGRLNSLRSQTRKRLEPLIGGDRADDAAEKLVRVIRIAFAYCDRAPLHKQNQPAAVISLVTGQRIDPYRYASGTGEGSASVPRAVPLAGVGGAHVNERSEYEAAHAREGDAA